MIINSSVIIYRVSALNRLAGLLELIWKSVGLLKWFVANCVVWKLVKQQREGQVDKTEDTVWVRSMTRSRVDD